MKPEKGTSPRIHSLRIALLFIFLLTLPQSASSGDLTILKSKELKPYDFFIEGVLHQLSGVQVNQRNIDGNLKAGEEFLLKQDIQDSDVVLTVGAEATYAAAKASRTYPVVFSMISNSKRFIGKHSNITGVLISIPLSKQLEMISEILPGVQTVGVIVSDEKTEKSIQELSRKTGLKIVTERIHSIKEIAGAMKSIVEKADTLWLLLDPIVTRSPKVIQEVIMLNALRSKMPVVGFNKWSVKAGALFAFYSDYEDIGKQAGDIINRLLNGAKASDIPIQSPLRIRILLNEKVMARVGSNVRLLFPENNVFTLK